MTKFKKKVAFHTLGCKLNFAETSSIARSLKDDLFERVSADEDADVYIINTCSVTDAADRKCRQAIKKFLHRSPGAFIAVVGCYAQLKPQDISSIPGVDLVLGSNEKFDLGKYLVEIDKKKIPEVHSMHLSEEDRFYPSWSSGDRTRSFLKVQDGCDYGCAYCTIPMARGKSRNPGITLLVDEAVKIAAAGIKELVLTGVNIGDFGKSTGESFFGLLKELVKVEGIERIRLSSVEPNLIHDELIRFVADNPKMLPHFHIPLQSGCNKILGLMRRRYTREVFEGRVSRIRDLMPFAGIGADVITGFPGENGSDFLDTFSFLERMPLSYLHIFSYSERPGTVSSELPGKVTPEEKDQRSKKLIRLAAEKSTGFHKINIGQKENVLFEKPENKGMITGFTGNYLKVEFQWDQTLTGRVVPVLLTGIAPSGNMTIEITGQ